MAGTAMHPLGASLSSPLQRRVWWSTYRHWVVAVVIGETLGFAIAAGAAIAAIGVDWDYWLIVAAGAAEGACLGAAQAFAFRRAHIPIPFDLWVVATAVAAAGAWAIGMLLTTLPPLNWSDPVVVLTAAGLGAALLLSIPIVQGLVLTRHGLPMGSWVGVNLVAWTLGIAWTFAPSPAIDATTRPAVLLAVYIVAGLLMALTVALITGLWVAGVAVQRSAPPVSPSSSPTRAAADS